MNAVAWETLLQISVSYIDIRHCYSWPFNHVTIVDPAVTDTRTHRKSYCKSQGKKCPSTVVVLRLQRLIAYTKHAAICSIYIQYSVCIYAPCQSSQMARAQCYYEKMVNFSLHQKNKWPLILQWRVCYWSTVSDLSMCGAFLSWNIVSPFQQEKYIAEICCQNK